VAYFWLFFTFQGNGIYSQTSVAVNLAITLDAEENVFSVTSNSTITSLAFNSTSRILRFSVKGDSCTIGYADVYIGKALVQEFDSIYVYVDGDRIDYAATSTDDSWLLHFIYNHSAHTVTVSLRSSGGFDVDLVEDVIINRALSIITLISLIIIAAAILALRRKRKQVHDLINNCT
jgi:hypothetical protein